MGKLYGISVGSGEPELITVKAVRMIQECPVIAVPVTSGKSLALSIAEKAVDLSDKKIIYLDFPMSRDKNVLSENYDRISEIICSELSGNNVAMLSLGDISVYSTFGYIAERVQKKGFVVEACAGVTSFCASAARLARPIVRENGKLHIIPYSRDNVINCDFSDGTYVIMKCGHNAEELVGILRDKNLRSFYAVENCGLPEEKIYSSLDEMTQCGYFTVFIVEGGKDV